MRRTLFTVAAIALLTVNAVGQQASLPPHYTAPDAGFDAALAASMLADEVSTHTALSRCPTCHEAGLATGPRIGLKVGVFTLIEVVRWRHPEHRRWLWLLEGGMTGLYGFVTWRNGRAGQPR